MRIAHLISNFPLPFVGGAEACVHNLASEQTMKGHEVKVIAPVEGDLPPLSYEVLPLRPKSVHLSMLPLINRPYFVEQLRYYQKRYKFDIWQVTIGYPFGVVSVDFFKESGTPCVLRCSGRDIQIDQEIGYGARLKKWPDFLIKRNYPKFDGFISIVKSITDDYIDMGIPKKRIHFIPNGVNKKVFDIKKERGDIRKNLGFGADKNIILTVGRNDRKKGFSYIPDIIEALSKMRRDFVWLLIGNKNDRIKKEAERRGLKGFLITDEIRAKAADDGRLHFPDRRLAEIYKASDIFAFPTLIEGCSTVVTEAMASGLPVVSTDAQGVRDMVRDGHTGLLSKRGDPQGMADNIERLLNDRGLYESIRKNVLSETVNLDWPIVADKYLTAYKDIIEKRENG